jgi:hypothetical protein
MTYVFPLAKAPIVNPLNVTVAVPRFAVIAAITELLNGALSVTIKMGVRESTS